NVLRIADHHPLPIAQHDMSRHAHNRRVRWHIPQHYRSRSHPAVISYRNVPQDFRARSHRHAVPNRRMPLPFFLARSAQRHALVQRHVVAHNRCFPNHHCHPVIDEQPPPNLRPRMNLNPRKQPRHLRSKARQKSKPVPPQPVRCMMRPHRVQPRVAKQHLKVRPRRRVRLKDRRNIFAHRFDETDHGIATVGRARACCRRCSNKMLLRYRSPNDGKITTISLPAFSARAATFSAATTAAPDEIPTRSPSASGSRRAILIASSFVTVMISSIKSVRRMLGTNPAPIPWILCGEGFPPESTGLSAGSTAIALNEGFFGLMYSLTPVSVPPVPIPETRKSTRPSVSFHISGPVVSTWILGFAGLSNCCSM